MRWRLSGARMRHVWMNRITVSHGANDATIRPPKRNSPQTRQRASRLRAQTSTCIRPNCPIITPRFGSCTWMEHPYNPKPNIGLGSLLVFDPFQGHVTLHYMANLTGNSSNEKYSWRLILFRFRKSKNGTSLRGCRVLIYRLSFPCRFSPSLPH
jgi:hypothetical protein